MGNSKENFTWPLVRHRKGGAGGSKLLILTILTSISLTSCQPPPHPSHLNPEIAAILDAPIRDPQLRAYLAEVNSFIEENKPSVTYGKWHGHDFGLVFSHFHH